MQDLQGRGERIYDVTSRGRWTEAFGTQRVRPDGGDLVVEGTPRSRAGRQVTAHDIDRAERVEEQIGDADTLG
jgi:hypothetical protein